MITFPREPIVEFFLNGWKEVTNDIRQDPGITIDRGRKDESSRLSPAKCTFTLDDGPDNGNGDYNPHNPLGQWYRYLKRNIPARVSLKFGYDDFNRTIVSGWGTSPSDGIYTDISVGTTTGSVSSGQGIHDITTTSSYRTSYLDDISVKGVRLTTDVTINGISNVTGGNLEPANLILRGFSSSSFYMFRVAITPSETVEIRLMFGGSQTLDGPHTISGLTYSGQTLRVSFQADANSFRGKVWNASSLEPLDWHLNYSHGDVLGAGWLGIRSGVGSGNTNTKPISYRYDNMIINIDRFTGETVKLVPLTEIDHKNQRTQVQCAGILRRLSQGKKPLKSPARRFLSRNEPLLGLIDYWPLEEKPNETALGRNLLGGAPARFTRDTSTPSDPKGSIKWGSGGGLASIERAPEISNGATLFFRTQISSITTAWTFMWLQRLSSDNNIFTYIDTNVANGDIQINFNTDGTWTVYREPVHTLLFNNSFLTYGRSDEWHLITVGCTDIGGGNVVYDFDIDAQSPVGQTVALSFPKPSSIEMFTLLNNNELNAYGQVALSSQSLTSGVNPLWIRIGADLFGYPGEFAGDRFNRLCDEQNISRAMVGYPTITREMGPQSPKTILDLLHECVIADHASMFDPRGDIALGMRTNRSVVGKSAVVTLDYSNHEIAPIFGPTTDDQNTVNDVTAKRPDGGEYQYVKTSGPMNISDPGTSVDGVGRVDISRDFNLEHDGLLIDAASWTVHLGTNGEPRFPIVLVDLGAPTVIAKTNLTTQLLDVDIDDALTVTNVEDRKIYYDIRQIVRGYTERFDTAYRHEIEFNCTPASSYDSATLDSATAREDSDTSTLNTQFIAGTNTSMSVVTSGGTLWTTSAGDFPFNIEIEGCILEVTNITGSSSPQTFTITQTPVNGIAKTLLVGDKVKLANPVYLML